MISSIRCCSSSDPSTTGVVGGGTVSASPSDSLSPNTRGAASSPEVASELVAVVTGVPPDEVEVVALPPPSLHAAKINATATRIAPRRGVVRFAIFFSSPTQNCYPLDAAHGQLVPDKTVFVVLATLRRMVTPRNMFFLEGSGACFSVEIGNPARSPCKQSVGSGASGDGAS